MADEWCNTLNDVKDFADEACCDMVQIKTPEQAVAAPLASCHFAQGGARVIKIEREDGDFARRYDLAAKGSSSYFVWAILVD